MGKRFLPHVIIVEDDERLRATLLRDVASEDLQATGFASAEAFLAEWNPGGDGCIVIDIRLPGMSGLALLDRLARLGSRLIPIVITASGAVPVAVRAMRAGAADFIEKPFSTDVFVKSVRQALAMAERRSPLLQYARDAFAKIDRLSDRERQVFSGFVDGRQGKQIAADLSISSRTVEVHRARIMAKLEAARLSDLIRLGVTLEISEAFDVVPGTGNRPAPGLAVAGALRKDLR